MSRVLLEFFSRDVTENCMSAVKRSYDRAVFFCFPDSVPDKRLQKTYSEIFRSRFSARISFKKVGTASFDGAIRAFDSVIGASPDDSYEFDLCGGSGMFIAAAGYYISSCGKKTVSMHYYSPESGELLFEKGGTPYTGGRRPKFDDTLRLGGAAIIGSSEGNVIFSGHAAMKEVERLWNAVRLAPKEWNRFCSLTYLETPAGSRYGIRRKLEKPRDPEACGKILSLLEKNGIVTGYELSGKTCEYTLSDSAVTSELYAKAGSVLESYTALAASCSARFRDIRTGTRIDTDGIVTSTAEDVHNEVDVTMMYSHRPVFISCKNTSVTKEYLYEIDTIARQYGGKYAIAGIVSSVPCNEALIARAKEMGIILIYSVNELSRAEFSRLLVKKFEKQHPIANIS